MQNVCRLFVLWIWCLRAKIHYYYTWPFAKKLYHGWISTMTSSNEISLKLPPPQNVKLVAPLLLIHVPGKLSLHVFYVNSSTTICPLSIGVRECIFFGMQKIFAHIWPCISQVTYKAPSLNVKTKTYHCKQIKGSACQISNSRDSKPYVLN